MRKKAANAHRKEVLTKPAQDPLKYEESLAP